jgi:hypothetical protein
MKLLIPASHFLAGQSALFNILLTAGQAVLANTKPKSNAKTVGPSKVKPH